MTYAPEQIEQWAQPAWDAYYLESTNLLWKDLSGDARAKQMQIADSVAKHGASVGNELEAAYAEAFAEWEADQAALGRQESDS
jgi:hypothetical protein